MISRRGRNLVELEVGGAAAEQLAFDQLPPNIEQQPKYSPCRGEYSMRLSFRRGCSHIICPELSWAVIRRGNHHFLETIRL